MKEVEILGRHMLLEGFRNVEVEDVNAFFDRVRKETKDCHVQFFDANLIAGFDHLYFAVLNALKAYETGTNISNEFAMETLLYASGQHQISKAIQLLGIKPDSSQIAVLIVADTRQKTVEALEGISGLLKGERCDAIVEVSDEKVEMIKTAFNIKDREIEATLRKSKKEALTSLLIERTALLATQS
ncbi:MAG: KEOPS complex subunit Cgi121 [Candidatus Bathyarchaeota archaeon]|nr:KEOPS complex subunit Cgi121 [Candidatus Bathyarchaeota archaeon]